MKYLNPIKGIIVWTFNCIEVWLGGLKHVLSTKKTTWSQTQTFFKGEDCFTKRAEYVAKEAKMYKKFKDNINQS